ncbi:MAG: arsenical pump rane protein, partial [Gaiellaceae bacterium]|nr:arsenical pump rane protein [Gaiellaceae bacterium]
DPPAGAEARPHLLPAAADELAGVTAAAGQLWPAFALVTGLLLVGVVAEQDGLFASAGATLARVRLGPRSTFVLALGLVTVVTAVLNLDTSVFFLTPVLLHLARARGSSENPYLYAVVFMSNAASLFLPGSNLTNLIVLHHEQASGAAFFSRMWAAAITAALVTGGLLLLLFRRELREPDRPSVLDAVGLRVGLGAAAVAASAALVLFLRSPALPVLGVGIVTVALARVGRARVQAAVDVRMLGGLFALAVALGSLGRWWHGPASILESLGRWQTAAFGAFASIGVNNLPAAVLLTPEAPPHPRALLLGLNLGPNLAVTGSLSALLWLRVARSLGARPSARRYSVLGLAVVPVSLAAAVATLWLVAPGRL